MDKTPMDKSLHVVAPIRRGDATAAPLLVNRRTAQSDQGGAT
jgi:hypothetical protein